MSRNHSSDIHTHRGLLALLPPYLLPYVILTRIDRPTGSLLLFLPALFGIIIAFHSYPPANLPSLLFPPLFLLVTCFLARAIGCCWNDIQDRHLDARVARTKNRPLASKTLSPKNASLFIAFLSLLSLPFLFFLPTTVIALLPFIATLVIIYPFAKRFTFWPQLLLGLTFNSTLFIGWLTASQQPLSSLLSTPEPFILYIAAIFWTLGYDTIYAHLDIKDDTSIGIKSTAQIFPHSPLPVFIAFSLFALLFSLSHLLITHNPLASLALIPAYIHTILTLLSWNISSPKSSLSAFKKQTLTGSLFAIGLAFPLSFLSHLS